MNEKPDIVTNLLVLALRMFILVFAMRYVGFNSEQTLILAFSICSAISIK